MILDYLEYSTTYMKEKKTTEHSLERQLKEFYSKDIREELLHLRQEIKKKQSEIIRHFYDNLEEYRLLKKHFPELFEEYFCDAYVGKLLSDKRWIIEFKPLSEEEASKRFQDIKKKRKQLREARMFLKDTPGKVDYKSLSATWNVLKDVLKDGMEQEEALDAVRDKNVELKKEGWKVLLNDSLILLPIRRLIQKLVEQEVIERQKFADAEKNKGKGTVAEYDALSKLRKANKERMCIYMRLIHLLLCNPDFLQKLKKRPLTAARGPERALLGIINTINVKKVDEKKWLEEMHATLS